MNANHRKPTCEGQSSRASSSAAIDDKPFGFGAKTTYNASENLLKCRSESYHIRDLKPDEDIWSRKPPDFRPQSFAPKPPPRNTRESMRPERYSTRSDNYYKWRLGEKRNNLILPQLLRPKWEDPLPCFLRRFMLQDPHEARMEAVDNSTLETEIYTNPKPHDHRGLPPIKPLGIDEFLTDYERDPFNIKFESTRLHTILGPPPQIVPREVLPGQFVEPVDEFELWSKNHTLKKDTYPNRPGSYSRFRRERPARSAFLNRVEEGLTTDWAREKMQQTLEDRDLKTNRQKRIHAV